MSEPTWELLGGGGVIGGPIDYVGDWAAGTAYQPGQIVRYQGVDYLAVNPSTGQTPPVGTPLFGGYGTTLPASPVNGMEAILVDSLTNPSYQWRFRYNAGSSSAYKWEFIGGSEVYIAVVADETIPVASVWNTLVSGPEFTVPRSGDYRCDVRARMAGPTGGQAQMGVCNASVSQNPIGLIAGGHIIVGAYLLTSVLADLPGISVGQTLRVAYWPAVAGVQFGYRTLAIKPKRVA